MRDPWFKFAAAFFMLVMVVAASELVTVAREVRRDSAKSNAAMIRCADELKTIREAVDRLP